MIYKPNDAQRSVISSRAPALVVLGGAGTGKTVTAVAAAREHLNAADAQVLDMRQKLVKQGVRSSMPARTQALFLSFSRTAVSQIMDRAAGVIGRLGPRLEVATFHGFAWRIITGFGAHHGFPPPQTVLSSANSRVPGAPPGLAYDDLIPSASDLLRLPAVAAHYAQRYSIVICDEFQDTSSTEWTFLQLIAPSARRIFLGDMHQSIYGGFKPGVSPAARIDAAMALPGARKIQLPAASYRDPSGVLPAAAEAARARCFTAPAITEAARTDRLRVTPVLRGTGHDEVVELVRQARRAKDTVSVFTHGIAATTTLSDALTEAELPHEQIGFGEAHGEALAAQLSLIQFALGDDSAPVRRTLAVFVTAALRRGRQLPPLAQQMLHGTNPILERRLRGLLDDLRAARTDSEAGLGQLADVVSGAYARIGASRGREAWQQAAARTRSTLRLFGGEQSIAAVTAELLRLRDDSLVGSLSPRQRPVQVMNLHQTKGREADTTILLLGPDEFYGYEQEPFPDGSRLLYVVLTRARRTAHLIVPGRPHPLWSPLVAAVSTAASQTVG
ncbi:UvrD-helicase domain-containing protein [Streptomyces luteocolor]|uniref:UvrD-helicase domain-containing protein n=1 Tax=Streptomyces luteocolor TaxID=285500 RepID=UPI000853A597|nr:UvrD-helicase domain-containing protein [Streptomyces luteocolor]